MRIVFFAFALLVGCADGTVPPPSAAHPASAAAPEGVATTAPAPLAGTTADHGGHDHDAAPPAAGTIYACPMHPEITSDKPGQKCPKCGMNLVPRKESP